MLGQATRLAPGDADTMVARGLLELGRHDFRAVLTWGPRGGHNLDLPDALGVVFDAQVELGRYQAAVVTAQAMVDRKPTQGSLARVSYARELLGDPAGAVAAMVQAAAAGGGSPTDQAYVQTLIGNLHLGAGRLAPASSRPPQPAGPRRRPRLRTGRGRPGQGRGRPRGPGRRGQAAGAGGRAPAPAGHCGPARRRPRRPRRRRPGRHPVRAGAGDRAAQPGQRGGRGPELARFEADHARDRGAGPAAGGRHGPAGPGRAAHHPRLRHPRLGAAPGRPAPPGPAPRLAAVRLGTRDALLWYHLAAVEADPAGRRRPAATWPRPSRSTPT